MKLQKKHVWILILSLIIFYVIILFVWFKFPYYSKKIPVILGMENVESELIDKGDSWMVTYEVYKLSDTTVKNFLEKKNKELYAEEGYKNLNWRKGRMDSLSYLEYKNYIDLLFFNNIIDSKKTKELYDSIKYNTHKNYLRYKGYFSYSKYVDSLRRNNDIDSLEFSEYINYRDYILTLGDIEKWAFASYGNNEKIENHISTIRKLFYDNAYYALHYKHEKMFYLYILDEKNNLLYITDYWL